MVVKSIVTLLKYTARDDGATKSGTTKMHKSILKDPSSSATKSHSKRKTRSDNHPKSNVRDIIHNHRRRFDVPIAFKYSERDTVAKLLSVE